MKIEDWLLKTVDIFVLIHTHFTCIIIMTVVFSKFHSNRSLYVLVLDIHSYLLNRLNLLKCVSVMMLVAEDFDNMTPSSAMTSPMTQTSTTPAATSGSTFSPTSRPTTSGTGDDINTTSIIGIVSGGFGAIAVVIIILGIFVVQRPSKSVLSFSSSFFCWAVTYD